MTYTIRPAKTDDASAACEVLRCSITQCCTLDHADNPQLLDAWLRNKTVENIRGWLSDPNCYCVVAEHGRAVVGFARMSLNGQVLLCYLMPQVRFTGVGKTMLSALEQKASLLGLESLALESTLTALPFYERNGYVATDSAKLVFGLMATPMSKKLHQQPD